MKTARTLVDDALRRFGTSDADEVWSLRVLRGEILNSSVSCSDAERYLTELRLPQRMAKSRPAVDRLLALAAAQSHCKETAAARKSFAAAERIARGTPLAGTVLVRRADFEIGVREWTAADRDLREAIPLARKTDQPRIEARAWAALGKLRGQQERYDEAIEANQHALNIAEQGHDDVLALVVRTNLGWLYVASGDYERAVELLTEADQQNARLGRKADRVVDLMQLGNAYLDRQQFAPAANYYRQALDIANELNSPARQFLLDNLARAEFGSGNYAAAKSLNAQALELERKSDLEAMLRSLVTAGRIAEKLGRGAEAEALYRRVIKEATGYLPRLEALLFLAEYHANNGKRPEAEDEFRRALSLSEAKRGELQSEELRLAFTTTIDAVVNDYIEFLIVDGHADEALRIAELSRGRALAEGLGFQPARQARIDFRDVARQRGTIVSYWLTPKVSFLWVVTPKSVDVFKLPPEAEIVAAVDAYQRELAGPRATLEMTAARGEALWKLLLAPAASLISGAQRIVIMPDKHLHALNFETLIVPNPQPHYWIEDVTITTASSIQLLARSSPAGNRSSLLLVGNPPSADPSLPPLPRAADEIRLVREHFKDANVLDGPRATPRAYDTAASTQYAFIHFVAHGVAGRTHPLDSAVVLGRDGSGYKLYARDIIRRPLRARLVTISSCHGAGQRAFAGEGLVGLAWAFLRAGAHQVIAALWEVSDSATPELMDAMYASIQRGDDPAVALRQAKLRLLHSNSVFRRPRYWAPFVLYSGA